MEPLPMPSDLRALSDPAEATRAEAANQLDAIEPPSVKLIVRLFLIPFVIVAIAVGVMFLIGRMAGGTVSVEEAINRLKNPGGQRTADWLVGPGSKQRYMDAKVLVDQMKAGMDPAERIKLTDELIDLLDNYTRPEEGEVQHFLLLALGRAWQLPDANATDAASDDAVAARGRAMATLIKYSASTDVATRKAALLAMVYFAGRDEASRAIPILVAKLRDEQEDLDVRLAAATALGPVASPKDADVVAALHQAMRDTDPHDVELVWASALSMAELNQPDVADTILKLLDRKELSEFQYYDRESDPKNPAMRKLSDQEQQRILINTMIGAKHLDVPEVQAKLKDLAEHDPSSRVRAAAREVLEK